MSKQSEMIMRSELVDAFIACSIKPFLILKDVEKIRNYYQQLELNLCKEHKNLARKRIESLEDKTYTCHGKLLAIEDLKEGYSFIFDVRLANDNFNSSYHGLKKEIGESALGGFHYVPLFFLRSSGVNNKTNLSLAF